MEGESRLYIRAARLVFSNCLFEYQRHQRPKFVAFGMLSSIGFTMIRYLHVCEWKAQAH